MPTTTTPGLTAKFCFNETAIRDFLRLSRSSLDDTISQHLSSLPTNLPPALPSDHSPRIPPLRRQTTQDACSAFRTTVLFPTWQARSDVLNYCAGVATSPDPTDPDHVLREIEDVAARERVVDERLDPYSGRYFPRDSRTERLATLVRSERMVEDVVRQRTWQVVGERCAGGNEDDWKSAMDRWRRS